MLIKDEKIQQAAKAALAAFELDHPNSFNEMPTSDIILFRMAFQLGYERGVASASDAISYMLQHGATGDKK